MARQQVPVNPDAPRNYDCKNRPSPNTFGYYAQDGTETMYLIDDNGRHFAAEIPKMVLVETQWDRETCGHTGRRKDQRCKGCTWRRK